LPYCKVVKISFAAKNEMIVSGNNLTANEEISRIFNQAGYQAGTAHEHEKINFRNK